MQDSIYCYKGTNVLKNKVGASTLKELAQAEEDATYLRLWELEQQPIRGRFDLEHLCAIHKYIFQDIYEWAGETRNVNISKGNSFCEYRNIPSSAKDIFRRYFPECYDARNDKDKFIERLAFHYGSVNILHPFREGNGRAQREFARELCLKCGYVFDLSVTTHKEMLDASVYSLAKADDSKLEAIFRRAIFKEGEYKGHSNRILQILSSDDLDIEAEVAQYDYYE